MPIYAYRCASCGHEKDVLQKMSDAPLTQCPACGKDAFSKQVTAAGFQLKGSGWYVTDFRGGSNGGAKSDTAASKSGETAAASNSANAGAASSSEASAPASTAPAAGSSASPASPASSGAA
ncbi:FmdB family zinc ribbon protein [Caballeronia concitans]|uniref:FmdB family regulatory protein n=1 Tax=Caballeronia concitans TaxID=1777133 RepID=A0A658QRC8_9BURK|nr:FmdB family zinc ribbon protein [Caballeronia concitans]KIG02237.1 regulatory protein, FmdB family [Burkholderia sp. MR1]SAL13576.1 FmdB family regulatory protein [Caballeronia concitans]